MRLVKYKEPKTNATWLTLPIITKRAIHTTTNGFTILESGYKKTYV